ncbi:growth arrest-specific protein 1-like [Ixodes scapularis]
MLLRVVNLVLAFSGACAGKPQQRLFCEKAQQDCIGRLACDMALHGHRLDCKRELAGRTPARCSVQCRQSFVSLATTEEGFTYLLCDCGRDEYCRALRRRTSSCWWEQPWANHSFAQRGSSKPTCSGLTVECMDDPVCSLAWDYYRRFCHEVLDGSAPQCSTRCRNSVSILLRMERAHRALECECDGGAPRTSCADEISRVRTKCFMLDDVDANGAASPAPSAATGVFALVGIMLSFGVL